MSFLDTLAAAVAGIHPDVDTNPQQSAQDNTDNSIVVTGSKAPPAEAPPPPPNMGNRDYIEEADTANQNAKEASQHKGLFGMHGTLRNVLGLIGDAFLVQGGGKALYAAKRDQEDESDALSGFTASPLSAMERLARNHPEEARDMNDKYQQNEYRTAQLRSLDADRKAGAAKDHYSVVKDARITASRALMAAGNDPAKQQAALSLIQRYAASNGVTMDELGLTPDTDLNLYAHTDMSGYQQNEVPIRQQTADAATENAAAHMKNASKPPRPPAPKATTNVQTYVGDDGYQYTQRSDGSVIKSSTKVRQKNGVGRRSISPAPTSGWGPVQRN